MSGAHIAIHAAQRRQEKKNHEEEERMKQYSSDDLAQGWEFKILRAGTRQFHKPEVLAEVLEEEALAGWEMVEKFDDQRLRFKRPAGARGGDGMLPAGIDPYRTQYGMSAGQVELTIVGIVMLIVVAIGLGLALTTGAF